MDKKVPKIENKIPIINAKIKKANGDTSWLTEDINLKQILEDVTIK